MWPTVAAYMFARVRPLYFHPSIELHQCCTVQGEDLPHYQFYWLLRKQLDIVNLTSCSGKRKREGINRGTEGGRQWERPPWHRQQFFLPCRTRGNDFPLDQRNHPTIKKLSVINSHYYHSCVKLYVSEAKWNREASIQNEKVMVRKLWTLANASDVQTFFCSHWKWHGV